MTTSLSNHAPSPLPVDCFDEYPAASFEEDPYGGDHPDEARLRGLSHQQLADRLNWLSWYQPGIFAAVMDYGQFSDDLAADTDPTHPTNPAPDFTTTIPQKPSPPRHPAPGVRPLRFRHRDFPG